MVLNLKSVKSVGKLR